MNSPQPPTLKKAGSGWGGAMVVDMAPTRGGAVKGRSLALAISYVQALKAGRHL